MTGKIGKKVPPGKFLAADRRVWQQIKSKIAQANDSQPDAADLLRRQVFDQIREETAAALQKLGSATMVRADAFLVRDVLASAQSLGRPNAGRLQQLGCRLLLLFGVGFNLQKHLKQANASVEFSKTTLCREDLRFIGIVGTILDLNEKGNSFSWGSRSAGQAAFQPDDQQFFFRLPRQRQQIQWAHRRADQVKLI